MNAIPDALEAIIRNEWPRLVGVGLRITHDLGAAEDCAQDALLAAVSRWSVDGVPNNPGAWLMTVCRNQALNAVRARDRERTRTTLLGPLSAPSETGIAPQISDDQLRLLFTCCHPALNQDAQIALTLRMVAGLSTHDIARGLNESASTVGQRISRAKRILADKRIDFVEPDPSVQIDHLPAIIDVIYLVFNEGYVARAGKQLTRNPLMHESYRLSILLTELAPEHTDAWSLRALIAFQLARLEARTDPNGRPIELADQDRALWNATLTRDGLDAIAHAERFADQGEGTPLLLQARLAACHNTAPSFDLTSWSDILRLYDQLFELQPTPIVALNRAVALSFALGPATALPVLDELVKEPTLARSHRVWAVRADLHRRSGHMIGARDDYRTAIRLADNEAERDFLIEALAYQQSLDETRNHDA